MISSQKNFIDARGDVAVVGAGPVGSHIAEMVKAVAPELNVKVFDKRPVAARDHSLRIGKDSMDAVRRFYAKYSGAAGSNDAALAALDATARQWRGRPVRTSKIETVMADHGRTWGVPTTRDARCDVSGKNLSYWLNLTQAHVVIGADGAQSRVREAIGARRCEEKTLGHLLEFKFSVAPDVDPRGSFVGSSQAVRAEGWDFETAGRADLERNEKRFTLHKFIDHDSAAGLVGNYEGITKGTAKNAWTLSELDGHAEREPCVRWVHRHIKHYLYDHELGSENFWDDRVLTFPMTVYRSTRTAKNIGGQVVALAGDANAGLVLERGANKGLMEAALCADATVAYVRGLPTGEHRKSAHMRYLQEPSQTLSALDLSGVPKVRPVSTPCWAGVASAPSRRQNGGGEAGEQKCASDKGCFRRA